MRFAALAISTGVFVLGLLICGLGLFALFFGGPNQGYEMGWFWIARGAPVAFAGLLSFLVVKRKRDHSNSTMT
jgi:hypothetical protein